MIASSHTRKQFPTYCPLALQFDIRQLTDELCRLSGHFESLATVEANIRRRDQWFKIADDALYEDLERFVPDPDNAEHRVFIAGAVPC